jgi:hypothetical protein
MEVFVKNRVLFNIQKSSSFGHFLFSKYAHSIWCLILVGVISCEKGGVLRCFQKLDMLLEPFRSIEYYARSTELGTTTFWEHRPMLAQLRCHTESSNRPLSKLDWPNGFGAIKIGFSQRGFVIFKGPKGSIGVLRFKERLGPNHLTPCVCRGDIVSNHWGFNQGK